jgi:hypothetical protein
MHVRVIICVINTPIKATRTSPRIQNVVGTNVEYLLQRLLSPYSLGYSIRRVSSAINPISSSGVS